MKKSAGVLIIGVLFILFGVWQNLSQSSVSSTEMRQGSAEVEVALPEETGPQVGKLAPPFTLETAEGTKYKVGGKQDKPIFLNFWASWCTPCQAEAPDLVKLYAKYKDKLELLSVNVTNDDTKEKAKEFVNQYGMVNPVLWDEKGEAFKLYNGIAFPTNILIDKNGVIRELFIGLRPPKDLEKAIDKLID
ncbi:MAG: TlpA disulfide reductase family protein [Paenibacillus dendritiformis]|uniref:TlpA family protein disulfide reductase n=1 Tax=Paenibacillus dendritiformis TaxID=130049 RepID=UPI001B141BE3|nr:TlpA disulfide reductase family protein [Paenibacillus dendritiformis]MDU5143373.1 TlpA disulfide reductase family protein [Paenibacillus dendritiformis]GIO73156.1 thiol:disulfide interchange protein [Paenibacillus dendritiformis]